MFIIIARNVSRAPGHLKKREQSQVIIEKKESLVPGSNSIFMGNKEPGTFLKVIREVSVGVKHGSLSIIIFFYTINQIFVNKF